MSSTVLVMGPSRNGWSGNGWVGGGTADQTRPDLEPKKKGTMLKLDPVANIPRTLACMIKKRLLLLSLYINLTPPFFFYSVSTSVSISSILPLLSS